MAVVERHPGLGDHRRAQHPFERHAPTPQPEHPLRLVREHRGLGARREQPVEHLGRLGLQRVDDLGPERVRVVELHHPRPAPLPVRRGPGVAVDDDDGMPAAGEGERGVEAGGTGSDDGDAHDAILPQPTIAAIGDFTDLAPGQASAGMTSRSNSSMPLRS